MPKNVLPTCVLFTNADMSVSQASKSIAIPFMDNISIALSFSATATGQFFVDGGDGTTMLPLPFGTAMAIPDADNSIHIELTQLGCSHLRVRYVPTSGTGTLNGTIEGKGI